MSVEINKFKRVPKKKLERKIEQIYEDNHIKVTQTICVHLYKVEIKLATNKSTKSGFTIFIHRKHKEQIYYII